MTLEPHEINSPLWAKLKAHYENELAVLRERNDGDLDEIKTAKLRGRLLQIKEFLLLSERTPAEHALDDAA